MGAHESRTTAGNQLRCFYAHSLPDRPEADWEPLDEHLLNVAVRGGEFAGAFGAAEFGRLAGLWHDLGKYLASFQSKLRGEQVHVDHAGPGAAAAMEHMPAGLPLAFAIAGHHAGLANSTSQPGTARCIAQEGVEGYTLKFVL